MPGVVEIRYRRGVVVDVGEDPPHLGHGLVEEGAPAHMGEHQLQPGVGGSTGDARLGTEGPLPRILVPDGFVGVQQQRQSPLSEQPCQSRPSCRDPPRPRRGQLSATPHAGIQTALQLRERSRLPRRYAGETGKPVRPLGHRLRARSR